MVYDSGRYAENTSLAMWLADEKLALDLQDPAWIEVERLRTVSGWVRLTRLT